MTQPTLQVGSIRRFTRRVHSDDVRAFAELTGDKNPIHLDEEFAKDTKFGHRVAHGMLVASYLSKILGCDYPGPGTIYLGQNLKFLSPIFIDSDVTIEIEVLRVRDDKPIAFLRTDFLSASGEKLISGEGVVMFS